MTAPPARPWVNTPTRSGQGQEISALVALNDSQPLVLERNNRGLGIGATLASPDKAGYWADLSAASDVASRTLPASGTSLPTGVTAVSKGPKLLHLGANPLAELGQKVPEKWEGLTIGPRLADGSILLVAGTDNDYSVTQESGTVQRDVYLRFSDVDPHATALKCPIGFTTGCAGPVSTVPLDGSYRLLPGVLQAYRVPAAEVSGHQAPVPGPLPALGLGAVCAPNGPGSRTG